MALNKKAISGIGALSSLGIFAATAMLVAMPQYNEAVNLEADAKSVKETISLREIRLNKLVSEYDDIDTVSADIDKLLEKIPPSKEVAKIMENVVAAVSASGVVLAAFNHGDVDPNAPAYTAPVISLAGGGAPFSMTLQQTVSNEEPVGTPGATSGGKNSDGVFLPPPSGTGVNGDMVQFGAVPITLTVGAGTYARLANFVDLLQNQTRFMSVVSVVASGNDDDSNVQATIYIYCFVGNTHLIQSWLDAKNPDSEDVVDEVEQ